MSIRAVIIDYGSGNVRSVRRALESAAAHAELDLHVAVTADPDLIARADRIVLPGVGHFADCAEGLDATPGARAAMTEAVRQRGAPFIGVCVGMQLLADVGREDVETPGLGWVHGAVERIKPTGALPVPHMGWNELVGCADHPVLAGLGDGCHVYFTHSYALNAADARDVAAWCDYGGRFTAAVAKGNIFGVQFHPEKSQQAGQRLLANFLRWKP
jgi:glutamine amidotransferase